MNAHTEQTAHIAEIQRVAQHLARAEGHAARRDVSQLGPVQRLLRQLLLQELARYRAEGRFPQNHDFEARTPYFIDASGTRCAMAHLLELGGAGELVEKIAAERNNARVRELVDEPGLLAWLEAAGLTPEEAAAIQPSYCSVVSDCVCGGGFSSVQYPVPAKGVLEAVVVANNTARVERTYGDSLGIAVGSEIKLQFDVYAPGTRVLAPLDTVAPGQRFGSIELDGDGLYSCRSQGVSSAPDLDADQFAQAVMAADCVAELRAMDNDWSQRQGCDDGIFDDGGGGCSTDAGAEAASVGVLLALVAAIVRRSGR